MTTSEIRKQNKPTHVSPHRESYTHLPQAQLKKMRKRKKKLERTKLNNEGSGTGAIPCGEGIVPPTHTHAHALSSLYVASLGERPQLSLKQFAG